MKFTHTFSIPVDLTAARTALADVALMGECLPGATVDEVLPSGAVGRVRVKVGPVGLTYVGELRYLEADSPNDLRLHAQAREAKGLGHADASILMSLREDSPGQTTVTVTTDLGLVGRVAQFGSGVITDVADQILGQFTHNLTTRVAGPATGGSAQTGGPASGAGATLAAGGSEPLRLTTLWPAGLRDPRITVLVGGSLAVLALLLRSALRRR